MATRFYFTTNPPRLRSKLFTYSGTLDATTSDVGQPIDVLGYSSLICTAQINTAGSGATFTWEGSVDNVGWFPLLTAVTPTAANSTVTVTVPPRYVRPKITGGSTTKMEQVQVLAR